MGHHDHTQDRQAVDVEVAVTDVTNFLARAFGGGARSSDFEGRKLNAMLDLVEHANPSELTNAGEALWKARDAIRDAAKELDGHIGTVDWKGEAGTSFQTWGAKLVKHTHALADFAGEAGTQITVAGSGLSSVRSSMPPRDERVHQKTVEELPSHKRVKGDPEYDAAVKVEEHRQEAINQMTRLASFYSVAGSNLAGQEPPTFTPMPDVGVPKPIRERGHSNPQGSSREELGTVDGHGSARHATGEVSSNHRTELESHTAIRPLQPHPVTTEIDHVAPPAPVTPPTDTTAPQLNQQGPTSNPSLPYGPGPGPVNANQNIPKAFGKTTDPQARGMGREAIAGNKNTSPAGRSPSSPMGRGSVNQARGVGRTGTSGGHMPMGRGVTGGTPRPAGPAKSSQAGAVRKGGVVGGRPSTGQPTGASSRVPRGTVIGGRQEHGGRSQGTGGKVGQRGVIGVPTTPERKPQTNRPAPGASEGVTSAPKERTTGPKGERAGFTSGGSGLVRGEQDRRPQDIDGTEQPPPPQNRPSHEPPEND